MENYEAEARKQGWRPFDEFDGSEEDWRDAKEFVERGKEIRENLKSRVEEQSKQIETLNTRVGQLLDSNRKINDWSEAQQKRDAKEREQLVADLEKARAQAVTDGDGESFTKLDKQINDVKSQETSKGNGEELDPAAKEWLSGNKWYEKDEDLAAYADGISERIAAEGYTGKAYFDELSRRVERMFPEKFKNTRRDQPGAVEEGGEIATGKGKTFDDLPAEAKRQFEQDKKDIPGLKKETWLAHYEWDE